MSDKFRKTEEWKREGKHFLVTVHHHTSSLLEESACFDSEGPHRWCVYAYIYPNHPHFKRFDGTERMWQDAASCLPLHGGPSFLRIHLEHESKSICSYQVGADYNHLHDTRYTRMADEKQAASVFVDANELFEWLTEVQP